MNISPYIFPGLTRENIFNYGDSTSCKGVRLEVEDRIIVVTGKTVILRSPEGYNPVLVITCPIFVYGFKVKELKNH